MATLDVERTVAQPDLMIASVAIADRDDRRIARDDDAPQLCSAHLDFESGRGGDERRWTLHPGRITIEIERLRKDPLAIGRLGQVSETADEFADLRLRGGSVVGEFAVAEADAARRM